MPVVVGSDRLRIADVARVADGAPVELAGEAVERIRASREVVDAVVGGDELVYGLNTGLGHLRDTRVPVEILRAYQEAIVVSHNGGIGPALSTRIVRAAMLVRIAGIAGGGAGTTPAVAETLVAMLNRHVHPIVPSIGSVGASDLMHMAAIAIVATGLGGRAEVGGEVVPGPEALRRARIEPIQMGPKDGLALISANGVSIGRAALVVDRADATADLADLVVATSLEATRGNPSIADPIVARAKRVDGQIASAHNIRAFLAASDRCLPGGPSSVQDPLSFRVSPQVHGAFREFVRTLSEATEVELDASDDNPFVSIVERRLISNGNFHPMVLALAADALRPAAAHLGLLSDHRMSHLWTVIWRDPSLAAAEGLRRAAGNGGLLLRYAAAARYSELRALAAPVTLDIQPLDVGVEDHATNAPLAVARSDEALDRLDDIFAAELYLAREAIDRDPAQGRLGAGVGAAVHELGAVIVDAGPDTPIDELHATIRGQLYSRILPAASRARPADR